MEDEIRREVNKWRRLKRERPERIDIPGPGQAHIFNLMYDLPTFQRPSASLLIGVQA